MDDWYKQALKKLDAEKNSGRYDRYANAMKKSVYEALLVFCKQDREFAQAVAQGGTFEDCMKAVAKGCGDSLPDLEAYRRAVRFYFPGADVQFHMTVNLCASVETGEPEPAAGAKRKTVVVDLEDYL